MQWCFAAGLLWVRCRWCLDLFGTLLAPETREGREAEAEGLPF